MNFLKPDWPAPAHIKAYTSLRQPEDHGSTLSATALIRHLQLPAAPFTLNQIHSAIVVEATPENKGKAADAILTQQANQVCTIYTADCLPIFICNQQGTCAALLHAGWRGLAKGIIEATLKALGQPPQDLLIWLGPAIGPNKFEVGEDVYHAFTLTHPPSVQAFSSIRQNKWLANIYKLASIRLNEQGVTRIYGGNFCTYTQADLFFSYRRDRVNIGRITNVIWIDQIRT